MLQTDTLAYDAEKIARYQSDSRFDYNAQLEAPAFDLFQIFFEWLEDLIRQLLDVEDAYTYTRWTLIIIFVLIVISVIYFIYRKRPELFSREKKKHALTYEAEEDNIYLIPFDKELKHALAVNDFRAAIRLLYLQTLRRIADKQWIDWQIYKTPTEYIYELHPERLKPVFRQLTNHFLQVRYGYFKATRNMYDAVAALQNEIMDSADEKSGK